MTRTLQTAYLLFQSNLSFPSTKFIVHPLLREKLHVSADLLSTYDLEARVTQWSSKFPKNLEVFCDGLGNYGSDWLIKQLDPTL
jgi:hypothetical protein